MKFDIARQPLVPAFLTLLAFAVAFACTVGFRPTGTDTPLKGVAAGTKAHTPLAASRLPIGVGTAGTANAPETPSMDAAGTETTREKPGSAGTPENPETEAESATGPAAESIGTADPRSANDATAGRSAPQPTVTMPDRLIASFQDARPGWAKAIVALLILFGGLTAGRLAVRYNLYAVATCVGIPLYGLIACTAGSGPALLAGFAAAALLALSVKNFTRSYCNGYAFDALFRASMYLSLAVLAAPAALPLLLLLPLAVVLFRRTLRETVVALAGLAMGPLLLCYINWGMGGDFAAPLVRIAQTALAGTPFGLFHALPPERLVIPGVILLLDLAAVGCLLTDMYAVGTKARFILLFDIGVLTLCGTMLCGPAATPALFALAAFPSALLLPFLLVRIHRSVSTMFCLLLAAAAAAGIFL